MQYERYPADRNLDCPPWACFNCRQRCNGRNGHLAMECEEVYLVHCENCGQRGGQVWDCPRCSKAYYRDGYYLENG